MEKDYKRDDFSTIEVNDIEEKRLVLAGINLSFEELPAENDPLSFHFLTKKFKEKIDLETFNFDTLKSLDLYNSKNGYNNAASLFADRNKFPVLDKARNINYKEK